MCWTSVFVPEDLIAEKDITVFKFTARDCKSSIFCSYYYKYAYEKGITQPCINIEPCYFRHYWHIDEGYHSYKTLRRIRMFNPVLELCNYMVGVFIIPKGSKYYENFGGEIVSESIIYTGLCGSLQHLTEQLEQ
ncbi:MAG TPA: hypothetical protein PJ990_09500 [Saprospiraceae bacterium]|nr:hypothetical protein [Saprospiraceae bacterium]